MRDDAVATLFGAALTLDVSHVALEGRSTVSSGGVRVSIGGQFAAARLEAWTRGRTLSIPVALRRAQPYRNPGVPDQDIALARREIAFLGSVKSAALVQIVAPATAAQETAAGVRRWVRHRDRQHRRLPEAFRSGLQLPNSATAAGDAGLGTIAIERGFLAVDVMIKGRAYRVFNTHLEQRLLAPDLPETRLLQV